MQKQIIPDCDTDRKLVDILDLGPRMCRWPIGDPHDKAFGFCGRHAADGSYCDRHHQIAYSKPTGRMRTGRYAA